MKWARKLLYYIFLLIYIAVCPALIMYALGYTLFPASGQVVRTGLVHLSTLPEGADIFLGRSRYKEKTPASITELTPGRYRVGVRKSGYRPWSHLVSIEPGKAAAFENIILIPNTPKVTRLAAGRHDDIIPMPGTGFIILKAGDKLIDYLVFDLDKNTSAQLIAPGSAFSGLPVISITTQPGSRVVLAYAGTLWTKEYLLIDTSNGGQTAQVTKLFPEKPDRVKWAPDDGSAVFTLRDGRVNRLDTAQMALYPDYIEGVKNFILEGRSIYTIGKDDTVFKREYGKIGAPEAVRDNTAYLALTRENAEYDKDAKRFLYWTKRDIFTAGTTEDGEKLFTQKVYAGGKNIRQCFWAYKGTHILFVDRNEVKLLELAPDGNHHVEPLTGIKPGSSVYYSDETGYLYYLDPKGGGLNGLRILAL